MAGLERELYPYFVHPEGTLFEVPVGVEFMVHQTIPAVGVHVTRLFGREIAWREAADLLAYNRPRNRASNEQGTGLPDTTYFA